MLFADGQTSEMLLIGAIGSSKFRAEAGLFVREVQRVKTLLVNGEGALPAADTFTPEFSGKKQPYRSDGPVESMVTHGLVVNQLVALLEAEGRTPHNDRNRDLYLGSGAEPTHLFEVKTDLTTTSIYTAVGQLMLHSCLSARPPRRIVVLPGTPTPALSQKLAGLNIDVLIYTWRGEHPVIQDLSEVLGTVP